jgi:microcompartment protein CcmK/EutM
MRPGDSGLGQNRDEEDTMAMRAIGQIGQRTAQIAAVAALALLLSGSAVHHAAAENQRPIDANVAGAVGDCTAGGGEATADWTFGEDGEAIEAVVSCDKGGDDGWYLCADDEGYYCDGEPFELVTGIGGEQILISDAIVVAPNLEPAAPDVTTPDADAP